MKKRTSRVLAAVLTGMMLVGCSSSQPVATEAQKDTSGQTGAAKTEDAKASDSKNKVTLELYLQKTDVVDIFKEMIDKFEAENPDIHIELTSVPDPETALVTRIASNDYPDIVTIWPAEKFYRNLMKDGALMDISNQAFMDQVSEETRKIAQYDGKDYALSMSMSAYGLIVNNKLFADNGIEKPQTWDELIDAAKAFQEKGIQPFTFCDESTEPLGQQAERMIGIINNDITSQFKKVGHGDSKWADETEMKTLAEAMLQIREYGQTDTLGTSSEDSLNDMATDKVAMLLYGSWGIQTIMNINPDADIEMIPIPNPTGGDSKVPASIDTALSITEACENKEAALKFLEYMSTTETAQFYADNEQNPPIIKGVNYNRPQLQTMADKLNAGDSFFSPSVYWPAGFRKSWEAPLQQLIMTKDVDAFMSDTDAISVEYFANEE